MDKRLLTTLSLLWLTPLCLTQSSCPSFEVGEIGTRRQRRSPERDTVYINTIDPAPCAGMVYGWRLCSHPITAPAEIQLSMYRGGDGESYELVGGSLHELTLRTSTSSYTCIDRLLNESEYFDVEQGDMVAACWSEGSNRVEIYSASFRELVSGGSCSESVIGSTDQVRFRELSLSAYINVDECILGESRCHENATCSDVVGGEDSYNCTCKPGYTGGGLSCAAPDTEDGGSENSTSQTNSPTSDGGSGTSSGGVSGGVVAAVVVVVLLVAILAAVACLVSHVLYKRKRLDRQHLTPQLAKGIDNEVYGKHYEVVSDGSATTYEVPQESLRKEGRSTLNYPLELVYEPTTDANIYASPDPVAGNRETSFNYGLLGDIYEQTVAAENIYESASPYECPSQDEAGLYEQISSHHINLISRKDIQFVSHLGSGQFGSVSKAEWGNGRRQITVAVKTLTDSANTVKFLQEAAIMAQFRHPNILTLHGVVSAGHPKIIVVELMHDGDLKDFVTSMRPDPGQLVADTVPKQLLDFSKQVALGLHYLSCRGFVHRDLAARNILVSNMLCKIADFGMSRDLADDDIYVSHGGVIPVRWTAPEAISHKKYSTASDVWSYGCVLYEIWSLGHKPFETTQIRKILQLVGKGYRLPPPPGCPKKIYKLMIDIWHPEASSRPQLRDVLKVLLGNVDEVLAIPPEDVPADSQAAILGAPLDKATHLYQDLQNTYTA